MMPALDAVAALVGRDLRAFLRSRSQLYSSVLFPLMLLAILGTGVSEGLDPQNIDDYVTFLTPGMIVMTALFSSTFSSASYYADRDSGMMKALLASPHSTRVILLGKTLSAAIIGAVQALLVLGVAALIPAIDFEWQYGVAGGVALAFFAIAVLNLFLSGLGQLLASRIRSMQGFHLVMNLVLFPFLFLSGAFFPLADLPEWLKVLGRANPLSYGVDALQLALYAEDANGYFGAGVDVAVMSVLAAAVFWFGTGRPVSADR
jgi:ABC-2 type transport system permease protein